MTKNQPPQQEQPTPSTIVTANQLLFLDELMIIMQPHSSSGPNPNPHPQYPQPTLQAQPQPLPQALPPTAVYPAHLYRCLWSGCHLEYTEPKALLTHLSEDHVGRRQRGNLNLSCRWTGCSRVARKRDHMVSHLKSHVPFWPHICNVCGNRFKHTTGLNRHLNRHSERGEIKLTNPGAMKL